MAQNRIRTLLNIVRSPNANEAVEVAAWNEIKAMGLDPSTQAKVSNDFIDAREARPASRSTASQPASNSTVPADRRPPQRERGFFEQLFGG